MNPKRSGSSSSSDSSSDRKKRRKHHKRQGSSKRRRMDRLEEKLEELTNLVLKSTASQHASRPVNEGEIGDEQSTDNLTEKDGANLGDKQSQDRCLENQTPNGDEQSRENVIVDLATTGDEQSQQEKAKAPDVVVLHENISSLLGGARPDEAVHGPALHDELAVRWSSIAKGGLPKEERERIRSSFRLPENCVFHAPPHNPELLRAVNTFSRNRDEEIRRIQNNVATSLAGLGVTLTSLLEGKGPDTPRLIKDLSDTARFLTGTQYQLTLLRRREIKSNIRDPAMADMLHSSPIYPELFGEELSAKVKQATTLSKVGQEIVRQEKGTPTPGGSKTPDKPRGKPQEKSGHLNLKRPFPSRTTQRPWNGRNRRK